MMDRRTFGLSVTAFLAVAGSPLSAAEAREYLEGMLDPTGKFFKWTRGGGNKLNISRQKAFAIKRLGLKSRVRRGLLAVTGTTRHERIDLADYEGVELGDVMIGGNGVLRLRVKPYVSKWDAAARRKSGASVWGWVDPVTNEEYRVTICDVCNNIIIKRYGAPVECECDPLLGDTPQS